MSTGWNIVSTPGHPPVGDTNITAMDVLQDKGRMKQLKAVFCDGIFSYADEDTADRILDLSLRICGGSPDVLGEVLQKRFFIDHTPFYWVLLNRHSKPGVPPLFTMLLIACDDMGFTQAVQEDIMEILTHRYESEIYRLVRDKLTAVPTHEPSNESYFHGEDDRPIVYTTPAVGSKKECTMSFRIPRFLNRLTVDGEVWIQFLALDGLFRLRASLVEPDANIGHSRLEFDIQEISISPRPNWRTPGVNGRAQLTLVCGFPSPFGGASNTTFSFSAPVVVGTGAPTVMSKVEDLERDEPHPYWEICTLSEYGRDVSGSLVITSFSQS